MAPSTEVLRGDLKEGQELMIGTAGARAAGRAPAPPASGGAPRLSAGTAIGRQRDHRDRGAW